MSKTTMMTVERERALVAAYTAGTPAQDVQKDFGIDRPRFLGILHKYGIRKRGWKEAASRGWRSATWKGGVYVQNGTPWIRAAAYAERRAGAYMQLKRYLAEQVLDRPLRPDEEVWNLNGDHMDCRLSNLEVRARTGGVRAVVLADLIRPRHGARRFIKGLLHRAP